LEFRILGPLEVADDGRQVELGGAKQRALLAMLLLHANEVVSSDRLIDALWEEDAPEGSRKTLQVYVSGLRKALGSDRLDTQAPGYRLRLVADELDVARFERLAGEGRFRDALALWRGPCLQEFAYQRFAQAEIDRLEELRLVCLERRIEEDLDQGRHAGVAGELEGLVRAHPLRERLRAQLMLALYRSGRQAEALEAYQEARGVLTEELGIEPSQELRTLQQAILQQDSSLAVTPGAEPPEEVAEPARGVFVGREAEVAELKDSFTAAAAGRGRLVLLVGEPGIGKSRLAEELIRHARASRAHVLVGRCWEAGGAPAFWPWVQSLRSYIRASQPDALRAQLGAGAVDLAQIVPEVREYFPDLPEPTPEVEGARFRLFEASTRFLRNASLARPLVLFLDDLHAADEPSLLMLRFVAGEIGDSRILLVGTYRDVDPTVRDPLAATLAELTREHVTHRIALSGLTRADVARYLELTAGATPPEALVSTIHTETEGNPLFVGEVVRLLADEGRLTELDARALWALGVPQGVREVIGRRVGRLSAPCTSVLTLAAILGREFELDALEHLSELPGDELFDVLDETVSARVLTSVPGAPRRLRFAHALIRETLYDQLTSVRRVQLHRQAGKALEALYERDPEPHLAELAYHFFEAAPGGDAEKAVAYARRAGERALALLAYEEAARFFELALQALELNPPVQASMGCDVLLALGDALGKAGSTHEAKKALLAAANLARSAGLREHLARAALGYGGPFPWLRAGTDERLVPLLEEALQALGDEESELRVRLLARLAGALRDQPSLEPRSSLSREAVAIAQRLGDRETLAYALVSLATATWGPDVERLAPYVDEVRELAEETNNLELMFQWGWLQHIVGMSLGETSGVEEVVEKHRVLADDLKQRSQQWYSLVMRSVLALFRGEFAEAERLAEEALELGERAQSWDAGFSYRIALFSMRREQGRLAEVEDLIREAIDDYAGYRSFRCLVPLIECELGRVGDARSHFDELARHDFADLPRDGEWLFNLSILAEVAAYVDDEPRARTLYELLLPYGHLNAQLTAEIAIGSVSRYLGILAGTLGRTDDAARHYESAIEMNERSGARPWVAHTQEDYARLLLERDDPIDRQRGGALLASAVATYRELGMSGPLAKVESAVPVQST
jgi:DNA-binding SARP family transcriptional activator